MAVDLPQINRPARPAAWAEHVEWPVSCFWNERMTWQQTLALIGWSVFIAAVGTAIIKLVVHAIT
jgi:hypothetical protein